MAKLSSFETLSDYTCLLRICAESYWTFKSLFGLEHTLIYLIRCYLGVGDVPRRSTKLWSGPAHKCSRSQVTLRLSICINGSGIQPAFSALYILYAVLCPYRSAENNPWIPICRTLVIREYRSEHPRVKNLRLASGATSNNSPTISMTLRSSSVLSSHLNSGEVMSSISSLNHSPTA